MAYITNANFNKIYKGLNPSVVISDEEVTNFLNGVDLPEEQKNILDEIILFDDKKTLLALEMFLQNPWTGIGINNFCWQNNYHEGLPFHTEYMVQLAECGIIGTLIFIVFYYGMLKRLLICYRKKLARKEVIILMATFFAFVVINLVAWTYTNANYFMMYGIIYGATESLLAYDGGENKSRPNLTE